MQCATQLPSISFSVHACGISPSWSSHTSSHHQLLFGLTLRCVYWYGDVTKEDLQAAIRMVLELKPCIKEITVFLDATSIFVEVLMSFSCSEIVFWFLKSGAASEVKPGESAESVTYVSLLAWCLHDWLSLSTRLKSVILTYFDMIWHSGIYLYRKDYGMHEVS